MSDKIERYEELAQRLRLDMLRDMAAMLKCSHTNPLVVVKRLKAVQIDRGA